MSILLSTCSQGLIYAILALGVYITFRILNFADMTAEGSLTLGGSVCAVLIINKVDPFISVIIAGLIGSLAGLATGLLHTKLKIQPILSGILTMIALYSVNIRIMGKANLSLLGKATIFKSVGDSQVSVFIISFVICGALITALALFFKTRMGLVMRATGNNEQMMRAQGVNTDFQKILALMISNFMCAVSGAIIAQSQGYADINMGIGAIVIALTSIVTGEALIRKNLFSLKLVAVALGSICYRFIVFLVLNLGMNPSDLKLFTAIIAAGLLAFPNIKKTFGMKRRSKNA